MAGKPNTTHDFRLTPFHLTSTPFHTHTHTHTHSLKCKVMRDYYQARPKDRKRMMEKLRASNIFKGKKSLYDQTYAYPSPPSSITLIINPFVSPSLLSRSKTFPPL